MHGADVTGVEGMLTSTLIGTPISTTKLTEVSMSIPSRVAREAVEHGSMIQATGKALLTGIRERRRSLTEPPPGKPLKLVILFVAVLIKAGRTSPGAAEIERVLVLRIEEALKRVDGIPLLEEWIVVAIPKRRAIVVKRAERARLEAEVAAEADKG